MCNAELKLEVATDLNLVFGSSPAVPLNMFSFLTMVKDLPAESGPPLELTMGNKDRLADSGSKVRMSQLVTMMTEDFRTLLLSVVTSL